LKYTTEIYIETTEDAMKIFSDFLPETVSRKRSTPTFGEVLND